jgi:hypothetical protein
MAIFQRLGGEKRSFVSIKSEPYGITLSATSFANRRDHYFNNQFVLPSDSVPDMFRGGVRIYGYNKPDESFEGEEIPWSGEACRRHYGLIAVADRLFDDLAGSRVMHNEIAWSISKSFDASCYLSGGKSKVSHLRLFFFHDKAEVVIMGFNKQSLTIDASQTFRKIHQVDHQSLWRLPQPPEPRDVLYFEKEETTYSVVQLDDNILLPYANIHYKRKFPFRRIQGMHKFSMIKFVGPTIEVISTPQIEPCYSYHYWIMNYHIHLTRNFHPDLNHWGFQSGLYPLWFRTDSKKTFKQLDQLDTKFFVSIGEIPRPEHFYERSDKIWKSLIGRKCFRSDGEEVYMAPDYQLLSYEGEYTPTKLIYGSTPPFLENCRFL